jgi:twitching motility protein PilT
MPLLDISFSDLFVAADLASSFYKATPDSRIRVPIPAEHANEFLLLRHELTAKCPPGKSEFRIFWGTPPHQALFRVKPIDTAYINPLFVIRRAAQKPSTMLELGWPPAIVKRLIERPLKEGLIAFMGQMGSGKTTSAAAFIMDYLKHHGGTCFTYESPIEIDMEGPCGENGYIFQHEVPTEEDIGRTMLGALRTSANMFFPGEARFDDTVKIVTEMATTGHALVTTIHADDLPTGFARMARKIGNQHDAVAEALSAAFHLELKHNDPKAPPAPAAPGLPGFAAPPQRVLKVTPLFVSDKNEAAIRSIMKGGNYQQLTSEIERQKIQFLTGGLP